MPEKQVQIGREYRPLLELIERERSQVLETILQGFFPAETAAIVVENKFAMFDREVNGYFLFVPKTGDLDRLLFILEASVR